MKARCEITDTEFEISASEIDYCRQNDLPLPRKCPTERLREMAIFLNMFHLYRTECTLTGKNILSAIPPEAGWRVAGIDAWDKDNWDELESGRDFDFKRPFFDQFHDLLRSVPVYNLAVVYSMQENSDYTNCITGAKDCYLCFAASEVRDCMYSSFSWRDTSVFDCTYAFDSELCYDCFDIRNCYHLKHSTNCIGCSDSVFLQSCVNCQHCYGCVNLANKQFYFFNRPLSRPEYEKAIGELDLGDARVLDSEKKRFADHAKPFPKRAVVTKNVEACTGNYVFNSKNCVDCTFVNRGENIESGLLVEGGKSGIVWCYYGNDAELVYNCCTAGDSAYNVRFCHDAWMNVSNLEYCMFCGLGTKDCFGSVALKRREHCILNKQYSKDEYSDLRARVVAHMKETGEWGRFFPRHLSPHAYNRSGADFFFPLIKDEALRQGWRWEDEPPEVVTGPVSAPPTNIDGLTDDLLDQTYRCAETNKPFKILKRELDFYRRLRIPPARVGPFHRMRVRARNLRVRPLRAARCERCKEQMLTVHDPSEDTIYCERCFAEEVY